MSRLGLAAKTTAATLLLLGSSAVALAATDSDVAFFGKDPGKDKAYACYVRRYDAAHLKSHPKQNVGDMTLFVNSFVDGDSGRQYSLVIGVHFRKKATLFQLSGGCSVGSDGKNALNCGIDCDGGRIDVRVKDASSILVSIPDGARALDEEGQEPPPNARFGLDDKLFRLDHADLRDCFPILDDDELKAELDKQK